MALTLNRVTPVEPALLMGFTLIPDWHGNSFKSVGEEVPMQADIGFME